MPRDFSLTRESSDAIARAADVSTDDVAHARETAREDCTPLVRKLLDARLDTRELIRSGA
jgi:hypothetical protein